MEDKIENELLSILFRPKYYWMLDDSYFIDVFYYQKNKNLKVEQIYRNISDIAQLVWERAFRLKLKINQKCYYKKILDVTAHQCIGTTVIGSDPAEVIATSFKFPNKKMLITVFALRKKETGQIGWSKYDKLLNSIKLN